MIVLVAALMGAFVGSFANVVIHRLPRGESVAYPPSHCPRCGKGLRPWELVPILSWLLQGGRCRGCRGPISPRYPLVEAWGAAGFALLAWRWPLTDSAVAPLLAVPFMALTIAAVIDLDTFELPDVLTLPGVAWLLLASLFYPPDPLLPTPTEAVWGALLGAGVLVIINRVGGLALRRLRDTRERLWPLGFDAVNLGLVAGLWGGLLPGLAVAAASLLANLLTRRTLRLPEGPLYAAALAGLVLAPTTIGVVTAVAGGTAAAGAAALAGAVYWWIVDLWERRHPAAAAGGPGAAGTATAADAAEADPAAGEPVAMGFGDVKLAALLGAALGWERLLVGVFLSVLLGAVGGVVGRALGGGRMVPFGPYLALGGLLAFAFGDALIGGYLGLLGVP